MTAIDNNGNGRLARIEADITYMRRDLDSHRSEMKSELESWRGVIDKRLEKIESVISRIGWIIIISVLAAILAKIGLGA